MCHLSQSENYYRQYLAPLELASDIVGKVWRVVPPTGGLE